MFPFNFRAYDVIMENMGKFISGGQIHGINIYVYNVSTDTLYT